jgi:RHS repeat-associated protein
VGACFEALEARQLLSTVFWTNEGDHSSWSDINNWRVGDRVAGAHALPGAADDATIDTAGGAILYTSAVPAANQSINSINSVRDISVNGGSLTVAAASQINALLTINGGTTVNFNAAITLGSVTLNSGGTLGGTADVTVGNFNWTGGLVAGGAGVRLIIPGSGGVASLNTGGHYLQRVLENDGAAAWTAGDLIFQSGGVLNNNGTLGVSVGTGGTLTGQVQGGSSAVNNAGTLNKDGAGALTFNISSGTLPFGNTGTVNLNAGTLNFSAGGTSSGVVQVASGTLNLSSAFTFTGSATLASQPGSLVVMSSDLGGTTTNADLFSPQGTVRFSGGTRQLEAMSRDQGGAVAGFVRNFAYGRIELTGGTTLQLVDSSDNAPGSGAEAVYVSTLVVPAGSTLNLNGLHLYARASQILGSVTNGAVIPMGDSGALAFGTPTPGVISAVGETDDWTVFGRGGRALTISLDPGFNLPPPGTLGWAEVQVLDPNGNALATVNNLASGQNSVLTLLGVALPTDGTYHIHVYAPSAQGNSVGRYQITAYDSTVDVMQLPLGQQRAGAIEAPYAADRWLFNATTNQQVQFNLLASSSSQVVFTLTGPNGYTAFADSTTSSGLLTLPASGQYVLAARGLGAATGSYSFQVTQTPEATLTPGSVYNGTLPGSATAQLFRMEGTQAKPLFIQLDDSTNTDRNELYASFGLPPTRSQYDARSTAVGADHSILIPNAAAGTWYILVYGDTVPTASGFTLRAVSSDVHLTSVTPNQYGAVNNATVTVQGAGFVAGTQLALVDGSNNVIATPASLGIDSYTQMTAAFNLAGVPTGQYSVRVTAPSGDSDVIPNAFRVTVSGNAHLETHLIMPGFMGRHGIATIYVQYANTGSAAMPAPLLLLRSSDPDGSDRPLLTLDQSRVTAGFWTSALPDGFSHEIQIFASGATPGVLNPGESFTVPVYYAGLQQPWDFSDNQVEMEVRTFSVDDTTPIDWNALQSSSRPPTINADAWAPIFTNLESSIGTTWGSYIQMLDDNAVYLGRLQQRVLDVGQLWGFEVEQAIGFNPLTTLSSTTDDALPTIGLGLSLGRMYGNSIVDHYSNGPFGRGWITGWQTHLSIDADGSVNVLSVDGARRRFQPDSRYPGQYFGQTGDTGTLLVDNTSLFVLREADGQSTRFRGDGKIDALIDTNGNRIVATYDGTGRWTGLSHYSSGAASADASVTLAYNAAGLISSVTDSAGRVTLYAYDASNQHLLTVNSYDGLVTTYTYSSGNGAAREHALTSIASGGTTRSFSYDARGRLIATSQGGGSEPLAFGYDSAGRVDVTDAGNGTTSFYYDQNGLLARVTDPLGNSTISKYDASLRLIRLEEPAGQSESFTWNPSGTLASVTNELGNTTTFSYGLYNRLTSFTDARGNTTRYAYDPRGNLTTTTYANNSVESVIYDAVGDATSFTNRRGQAVGYTYNAAGQVTRQTFPDSTHNDFTYDTRGNLLTSTDTTGVTTFTYDSGDRLTRVDYPGGRYLVYTYDAFGRRTQMRDQDNFITSYSYDAAGRLHQLTDGNGANVDTYTYDAAGRLSREDKGNGTYTTYQYDLAGQLLHLINYLPGGTVSTRFDYTYDSRGRRVTENTIDGLWTYSYDDTGQLTHAVLNSTNPQVPSQDLAYVYDAVGNRIRTIENGVTTEYTTNNMNQYTQVGADTLTYDADGNLIGMSGPGGSTTYTYDVQGRLAQILDANGTTQLGYDALGNLMSRTVGGAVTRIVTDFTGILNIEASYSDSGASTHYVFGIGYVASVAQGSGRQYVDFDGEGATADATNDSGAMTGRGVLGPFGATLWEFGGSQTPLIAGQWGGVSISVSMTLLRNRTLDISLGRFTTVDPIRLQGLDFNFYRYASNDPIGLLDPLGLYAWKDISVNFNAGGHLPFSPGVAVGGSMSSSWHPFGRGGLQANGWQSDVVVGSLTGDVGVGMDINWGGEPNWNIIIDLGPLGLKNTGATIGFVGWMPASLGGGFGLGIGSPVSIGIPLTEPHPGGPGGEGGSNGDSGTAASGDPNQKLGPSGYGALHYIQSGSVIPYTIDFENTGPGSLDANGNHIPAQYWATAPAQSVTMTDTLSGLFDWSSFRLTEVGFGDNIISVASGQYVQTVVPMTYNGRSFEVLVEAGLNITGGVATVFARFFSIDPATFLPPDVLTGFLPPEDGTGRGKGHISYTVLPGPGWRRARGSPTWP